MKKLFPGFGLHETGGILKVIIWHQGKPIVRIREAYKQKLISLVKDLACRFGTAGSAGCCRTDFSMELDEKRSWYNSL